MSTLNINKLNGKIAELGFKKKDLAMRFGISVQALNNKLRGKTKITTDDAVRFCEILNIDNYADRTDIFLS